MKKNYIAPSMEVELFELNDAIAAGCADVAINSIKAFGDINACLVDAGLDPFGDGNIVFNEGSCDCYYTGGSILGGTITLFHS